MVKKLTKQYETPQEGWDGERIERETELQEEYGLVNKKELYRAESELRSLRRQARKAVAAESEDQLKPVINKAQSLGLIKQSSGIDEVLSLNTTDILDRRLQTIVEKKGFADTAKEARQLVTHGHIYINGERVNIPGYLVDKKEQKDVKLKLPEKDKETKDENKSGDQNDEQEKNNEEGEE